MYNMSNVTNPHVERTEVFFRHCNDGGRYLRSGSRITDALGVLGVSNKQAAQVMASARSIWERNCGTSIKFLARSPQNMKHFERSAAELCAEYPEIFQMSCEGAQEEKFVRQKAPSAIIWLVNEYNRPGRSERNAAQKRARSRGKQEVVNDLGEEMESENESPPPNDREHALSPASCASQGQANATIDDHTKTSSPASPAQSEDEASPLIHKKAKRSVPIGQPPIVIEVWSSKQGSPLIRLELKNVLAQGGRAPSLEKLRKEVHVALPSNTPSHILDDLWFVHVLSDETNTRIISQEVLEMEFVDWRKSNPKGRTFHLYVIDHQGNAPHPRCQPPKKMTAYGYLLQPMFTKLPLQS